MLLEALKKRREKDQAKPAAAGDEGEVVPASEGASPSRAPTSTPVARAGAAAAASPDILSTASPELAQTSYIEPEVLAEKLRMLEVSKDEDAEDEKELSTTLVTACSGKTIKISCAKIDTVTSCMFSQNSPPRRPTL
jgi:hypothetical protein